MKCSAIKTNGSKCTYKCRPNSKWCGVHRNHINLNECLICDDDTGLNYMDHVDNVLKRLKGTREWIDNQIKELEIEAFDMDTLTDQMNFITSVFNAGLHKETFDDTILNKAKYIFVNNIRDVFNVTVDLWNLTININDGLKINLQK